MNNRNLHSLLEGALDLHCHVFPGLPDSYYKGFDFDEFKQIEDLKQHKIRGLVLKSHFWPTIGKAALLKNR